MSDDRIAAIRERERPSADELLTEFKQEWRNHPGDERRLAERVMAALQRERDAALAERSRLAADVERLREALEHYANERTWGDGIGRYPACIVYASRTHDGWERARAALAPATEGQG